MSSHRKCDSRCHTAKRKVCACWCGGVFHGAGGQAARDAFVAEFQKLPVTEDRFDEAASGDLFDAAHTMAGDRWRKAIAAAVQART